MQPTAYRASILTFTDDPLQGDHALTYEPDGLLVVDAQGMVAARGSYHTLAATVADGTTIRDYRDRLIVPGFIDTHVHYPQIDIVGSPAEGLLPWLDTYTFPAERRFGDPAHAARTARFFVDQLLACGTTTAVTWCTVHPGSVDAMLGESRRRNLRMIAGKVMMDRNCPDYLRDTAQSAYDDSAALIARWHGTERQHYAITPRFALTSSEAQLDACATLAREHPDVFVQTHVAENLDEIRWAAELFPAHRSYLDVYDRLGLLRPRAIYGHCIHLDKADRRRMAETGAVAAHCPTSNLFLGSGLFDFAASDAAGLKITLGTDVGGGTSLSMLQTMNEAYKVARMGGTHLSASRMFYFATLGAARALRLDDRIGTLAPGAEADFIVLDSAATPLLAHRAARAQSLEETLFALAMLGDDRAVAATYAAGACVHRRDASGSAS
ncbi:guanine deaminase [Robbsia sp. Bb-Pol-6]|uniref:Guanine deaminase n=1 Tax=Robbsia betulipollinis TaxID=2981849 RepID=A0ABT3ZHE4_9BURK|nr:guanine deaminase [Robbsia betulipollinis]MCY0385772.1 guanine deaminase [Robbsia betulipollinis]